MRKIFILGAMSCLFAACKPNAGITTNLTTGKADFTNYLAIGNSMTAGYTDGSLTVSGQLNSYPQRLFEQFQLVTSIKGTFVQPLVTGNFGYPWPKKVLTTVRSGCSTDSMLGAVDYYGALDSLGSYHFTSTINNGQINNIAVPGIRVGDYQTPNYPITAATPSALFPLGLPYAARFYNSSSFSPLDELAYTVHNLHPSFFTMWLGANDVLGYALSGGQGDGSGHALPSAPNFYNPEDITPYLYFDTCYQKAVDMAISTGARGALINIPDITSLPYFSTIPINGLTLTRQGQADTLQARWGSVVNKVFQVGSNCYIVEQHDGLVRQAVPGELILASIPKDAIRCQGWGITKPIPKEYVLTTEEIQHIRDAVNSYNTYIKYLTERYTQLAYVDMNSYMKTIASGYTYNGITYNTQYISGGAFSLDAIHPNARGYALIANEILRTINAKYESTIPMLDVNKYHGVDFP